MSTSLSFKYVLISRLDGKPITEYLAVKCVSNMLKKKALNIF